MSNGTNWPPLGLYVHLPWCVRKCPYCDFNSYENRAGMTEQDYVDAVMRDLSFEGASVGMRSLATVFIGGGTPSLFSGAAIRTLLDAVRRTFVLAENAEVTLEANPGAVDRARFLAYREAGVNRLSIGIQSFRAPALRRLGRIHGADDAEQAIELARASGFANINIDLMYGLPGEQPGDARADLRRALTFSPAHLSWYELTIEPGTAFGYRRPALPDDDLVVAEHEAGQALLAAAGLGRYEISAYARPGFESRHNLNYWRFGDYIGVGAGAHGKLCRDGKTVRRVKQRHPGSYIRTAGSAACLAAETRLSQSDLVVEFMLNALRLTQGFDEELFERRTGLSMGAIASPLVEAEQRGWLRRGSGRIVPTAQGLRFLDDVQLLFVEIPAAHAVGAQ